MKSGGPGVQRLRKAGLAAIVFVSLGLSALAEEAPLAVIVHPSRADTVDEPTLRRIYLRVRRQWGDGTPISPVNREAECPARELFARRILGMSPSRIAAYWNERYFEGVFPPITLSSDVAIKRYVAAEPGAIGYVDPALVDETVRQLFVLR